MNLGRPRWSPHHLILYAGRSTQTKRFETDSCRPRHGYPTGAAGQSATSRDGHHRPGGPGQPGRVAEPDGAGEAGQIGRRGRESNLLADVLLRRGNPQAGRGVARQYLEEYGVQVNLDYGGSNTLLSRIDTAKTGDLYLAADESYINAARKKGLVAESLSLARMKPVIAVADGNPKNITRIEDLLREDVRTVLGNPDQAAVGKKTRKLLKASGHWTKLEALVRQTGTFQPTVPEVANTVKIGGADAAVIWNTTTKIVDGIEAIEVPELDKGEVLVTVGVLTSAINPTESLRFARYLAASDRGLKEFRKFGFTPVDGDKWSETPELTFFCGSVNRRAVEQAIKSFQAREGVQVNTVFNGCGILTAQMKTITNKKLTGFPDTYMACDKYYLKIVDGLFQDAIEISDTEVVIAVPKGNPKQIKSLADLARPGMRVAVGQPDQCTIGVLTRQVLEAEKVYEKVMANVVTQTATSALLIAPVSTGAADASLAY
ncbi:MAG: hypothetical protein Ct9H300mP1_38970 [Planctomycetaceae bacterium]|nr:MAG: hypothetical protein Ct9H300mP1_38970 [Planctomycetaceae bacterium]